MKNTVYVWVRKTKRSLEMIFQLWVIIWVEQITFQLTLSEGDCELKRENSSFSTEETSACTLVSSFLLVVWHKVLYFCPLEKSPLNWDIPWPAKTKCKPGLSKQLLYVLKKKKFGLFV